MMWAEKLGKQLGHPTRSVAGWLVSRFLTARNRVLEENAVQLSGIQPGDTVLELGHGPGLGLQSAAKLLTEPTGRLIGVDYSEYMHQMASERMKELVASGKVTLHHCDVAAMPLADSIVDKVFHCNCYYFWPDLRKGATEIHRVMKPGSLMVTTLTLKSSPMTRVNDVIYFHSVVWMWFVMWTVSKQIPVTSAVYSMCWEANPASTAQRGVLDSSTDPGEDWTDSPLL
uniref:Zgc:194242 n=1 Tax=Dicentrarchus labrax TaxID=13489 RepID=A0A8C4HMD3_DICLA